MNIILIDTSYIFHRVVATKTWSSKANKTFNNETIYDNFISSITKLSKKFKVNIEDMILCRDSRSDWRKKLYPKYKEKRKYSDYGPYIKDLYKKIEKMFKIVVRIKDAEADDIIAILTFYYLNLDFKNKVYIISNDKDFYQLKSDRVFLVNNSLKIVDIKDFNLEDKIIKGDNSDNIKKLKKNYTKTEYLLNKQLIDLSYVPRYIQDEIFKTGHFIVDNNTKPLSIQLGFACINTELREQDIFCSRTTRLKTVLDKGVDYVKDLIVKNIRDLRTHVEWNYKHGIRLMRISSELFPHYSNPKSLPYTLDFVKKDLKEIGYLARMYKQRLTFHPGQYNVLSTNREEVFISTKNELKMHADILDLLEMDQDSIIVIHGGGIYGDKEAATKRFIDNFNRLDENVKRRLVIENCESCYNIIDVLYISSVINIPVIFDIHHFSCYNINNPDNNIKEIEYYIPYILETWNKRNIKPKFHISEQKPNGRIGSHSDYVECIPKYLLEIPEIYGMDIDIMIEAKAKQDSVLYLYNKYPILSPF